MALTVTTDKKCIICNHDIDYHGVGCNYGNCECKEMSLETLDTMLYEDKGITWP